MDPHAFVIKVELEKPLTLVGKRNKNHVQAFRFQKTSGGR